MSKTFLVLAFLACLAITVFSFIGTMHVPELAVYLLLNTLFTLYIGSALLNEIFK